MLRIIAFLGVILFISNLIASTVIIEGTIENLQVDYTDGRSEFIQYLNFKRGSKIFRKRVYGLEEHASGTQVKITAEEQTDGIYFVEGKDKLEMIAAAESGPVGGTQDVSVILVNFADSQLEKCDGPKMEKVMFTEEDGNNVADFYTVMSNGALSITGQIAEPVTINKNAIDQCNPDSWATDADKQAQKQGMKLAKRRLYVLADNGCPWGGLGNIGGQNTRAWVQDYCYSDTGQGVVAHELGHNFGMRHASSETGEYGDLSDVMGSPFSLVGLNAPHLEQQGWLLPGKLQWLDGTGEYWIDPLEVNPYESSNTQVLKVKNPKGDSPFFISYRTGEGYGHYLSSVYRFRVLIHQMHGNTVIYKNLGPGNSFVKDSMRFVYLDHGDQAHIRIDRIDDRSCEHRQSEIQVLNGLAETKAGLPVTMKFKILNHDGVNCEDRAFHVTYPTDPRISVLGVMDTTVAPQSESAIFTINVVPSSNITSGTYPIPILVASEHGDTQSAGTLTVKGCQPGNPQISIANAIQEQKKGHATLFSATIKNGDANCPATQFRVTAQLPPELKATVAPTSLYMSSGQSTSVIISVSETAAKGAHLFGVSLSDANKPLRKDSKAAVVVNMADTDLDNAKSIYCNMVFTDTVKQTSQVKLHETKSVQTNTSLVAGYIATACKFSLWTEVPKYCSEHKGQAYTVTATTLAARSSTLTAKLDEVKSSGTCQ